MSIFDFAMKMEKDGEAFYRDIAARTEDEGLKTILTMMADEEVKHYNTFKALKEGKPEMDASVVMENVTNVFEDLKNREGGSHFGDDAVVQYRKAMEVEKMSEDLYREKADEVEDDEIKKLLNRIADEERRHFEILENMVEMVERPNRWIEDSEWHHLSKEY